MFFWNGIMKFKWFEDEKIELISSVFIISLLWFIEIFILMLKNKENSYFLCRNIDRILCKLLFFLRMILNYKLKFKVILNVKFRI